MQRYYSVLLLLLFGYSYSCFEFLFKRHQRSSEKIDYFEIGRQDRELLRKMDEGDNTVNLFNKAIEEKIATILNEKFNDLLERDFSNIIKSRVVKPVPRNDNCVNDKSIQLNPVVSSSNYYQDLFNHKSSTRRDNTDSLKQEKKMLT